MISRRQLTTGALAALATPQMFRIALAQDGPYPSRAMRSICMFPPGSGADISVRFLANKLSKLTGQCVIVEYKTSAGAVNDMTGGNLVFGHYDFRGNAAAIRSGRIRALATSGSTRMKAMPDVPSAKEIGLKHQIDAWWTLHVPAKTPEPVIAKLEQWMNQIVADPETQTFLTSTGAEPLPGNRKLVRQMLERNIKAWGEYVKIAKIQPL